MRRCGAHNDCSIHTWYVHSCWRGSWHCQCSALRQALLLVIILALHDVMPVYIRIDLWSALQQARRGLVSSHHLATCPPLCCYPRLGATRGIRRTICTRSRTQAANVLQGLWQVAHVHACARKRTRALAGLPVGKQSTRALNRSACSVFSMQ